LISPSSTFPANAGLAQKRVINAERTLDSVFELFSFGIGLRPNAGNQNAEIHELNIQNISKVRQRFCV
jgi:hypothetical protein